MSVRGKMGRKNCTRAKCNTRISAAKQAACDNIAHEGLRLGKHIIYGENCFLYTNVHLYIITGTAAVWCTTVNED